MPHSRIDLSLGLSWRAMAVLHALHHMEENMEWERGLSINSYAFYNGRERGVCLEVRLVNEYGTPDGNRCVLVAFAECRASDGIFVQCIHESSHSPRYGGIDLDEFTEESYSERSSFDDVEDAAMHVMAVLEGYATKSAKAS